MSKLRPEGMIFAVTKDPNAVEKKMAAFDSEICDQSTCKATVDSKKSYDQFEESGFH